MIPLQILDLLHLDIPDIVRWPLYTFMTGAMCCLLVSAVAHTFWCCSKHVSQLMWRLDYAGIATLIVTSFYPPVYYGMMCHPRLRAAYLSAITILGAAAIYASLAPHFQSSDYHFFRAGLFLALGLCGIIPAVHHVLINGTHTDAVLTCEMYILMGLIYIGGTVCYATRVPERWLPGWFDRLGHSHQIFHVLIVLAALVHYEACIILMRWRTTVGCSSERSYEAALHALAQAAEKHTHILEALEAVGSGWTQTTIVGRVGTTVLAAARWLVKGHVSSP